MACFPKAGQEDSQREGGIVASSFIAAGVVSDLCALDLRSSLPGYFDGRFAEASDAILAAGIASELFLATLSPVARGYEK